MFQDGFLIHDNYRRQFKKCDTKPLQVAWRGYNVYVRE